MPEDPNTDLCPANCPGCSDKGAAPETRLAEKAGALASVLSPWRDRLEPVETAACAECHGYRNKVCLSAGWAMSGWRLGLKRRQAVIPIHDCPVHAPLVRQAVNCLAQAMPGPADFPLAYYVQSKAQVTLVLKTRYMPDCSWMNGKFRDALAEMGVEGFWVHLHPSTGNRVFAKNGWHLAWGRPRSITNAYDAPLQYGPTAFQQLIPSLFNRALDRAESFLSPESEDLVIDLYSGIGATLARWTNVARNVVGVETSGESVACARHNAPAAKVLRGACAHRVVQLNDIIGAPYPRRLAWVNPPRTGMEPQVVNWLANICRPDRMAYLSCNPRTLARDLAAFQKSGYAVVSLIPHDFFPNTRHIETLALAQKVD